MAEYWDRDTRKWLDEETGRTAQEQRDFQRGYEAAGSLSGDRVSMPAIVVPERQGFSMGAPRVTAKGDRGTWQRTTVAGQLRSIVAPDDPEEAARERAAAKEFIDNYEFVYGRRPTMAEARLAVGRRSDGVVLDGVDQIRAACQEAGIAIAFVDQVKPLPQGGAAVSHQPTHRG